MPLDHDQMQRYLTTLEAIQDLPVDITAALSFQKPRPPMPAAALTALEANGFGVDAFRDTHRDVLLALAAVELDSRQGEIEGGIEGGIEQQKEKLALLEGKLPAAQLAKLREAVDAIELVSKAYASVSDADKAVVNEHRPTIERIAAKAKARGDVPGA